MFSSISRLVIRRPGAVVLCGFAAAALLLSVAPRWDEVTKDDDVRFFPPGYPSVVGQNLLERGFPRDAASSQVVLACERPDGPLTSADYAAIDAMIARFSRLVQEQRDLGVKRIDTYKTPVIGPRLRGDGGDIGARAVLTIISLDGTYQAKTTRVAVDRILDWADEQRPELSSGLRLGVTGSAVVGHDINTAANESIENTTWMTVFLVVVILLIVYRSPLLAMIPLVTIALSVVVSLRSVAMLTKFPDIGFQVINITKVFVVVVLFGAGTDYCLFLIARYTEELKRGRSRVEALRHSIEQVGGALVASAGTVIVGLGMLFFSNFAKIKYTGPTIAVSLAVALLASLTMAPSMLALLQGAIYWPFREAHREGGPADDDSDFDEAPAPGFWIYAADLIVRHPGAILSVCLVALLPLAVVGYRARPSYNQLADLDPDRPSVVGSEMIRRHFAVGELSPATALVDNPKLDFRSETGRTAIAEVSRRLLGIENVAEVRSLTQPVGRPLGGPDRGFFGGFTDDLLRRGAISRYVGVKPADSADAGHITRFDIVFKTDPFSQISLDTLERVRGVLDEATAEGQPIAGTRAIGMAGSTSMVNDLRRVTTADLRRMYVLITIGIYVILVVLLRRPGIGLYLVATVVLGYLASLGLTDLVFSALHRGPAPWGGLDWIVGFFLFVILVAVGEDYNIFLMARVLEEERKYGVTEGTRRAVAHTGGIISSCGLIMAGTFGALLVGKLASLRELGFALSLGVLLDTFLVRPILVPAFLVLLDRVMHRPPGTAMVRQANFLEAGHHHAVEPSSEGV